jgi:hypothetical protein
MELIDLIPNSLSFRIVATLDLTGQEEMPEGFTGRVRRSQNGHTISVAWYQQGLLHNPSRSHPAFRCLRADAQVKFEMWYLQGTLQDPSRDAPAVRGYYADGALHYEEHWAAGRRHDGADGSPAIRKWRADGTLRHELRYQHGARAA